jgi:hypothetical protein
MRSRDFVAAFRDLLVSFKDSFVNLSDPLVIFDPTNRININNYLLLPINRAQWLGERDFCLFATLRLLS